MYRLTRIASSVEKEGHVAERRASTSFWEILYSLAGSAVGGAASLWSRVAAGAALRERVGHVDHLPDDVRPLWYHGASVGELATMIPLAAEIERRLPGLDWGVTSTTVAGQSSAVKRCPSARFHHLLPLDAWPATERFVSAVHPAAVIIVETEIWPHLIRTLARKNVPICLASARVTSGSVKSYRRVAPLFKSMLELTDLIAARSEEDRERFLFLGAPADRTVVLGNTKLDAPAEEHDEARVARIGELAGDRHLVVWGCLRPGEEELVINAYKSLKDRLEGLWVLAPRHLPVFESTAARLTDEGLAFSRWSRPETLSGETDLLLLDTLGELRDFYACADVAVVGGTFGGYGGHNLMEPAQYGVPVIFGRDTSSWPEDAARLLELGGGRRVHGPHDLTDTIFEVLSDPEARSRLGSQARSASEAGRGASARIVDELLARDFFHNVSRQHEMALP